MIGAIQSIENAGRTPDSITLVGFDALARRGRADRGRKGGRERRSVPRQDGRAGARHVLKAVNGEDVPPKVDTGTEIVTKENASDF